MAESTARQGMRYTEMSGAQRAAVALMSLSEDAARAVLAHLSPAEIEEIGVVMSELEWMNAPTVDAVVMEFTRDLLDSVHVPQSGKHFALHVLPDLVDSERKEEVSHALEQNLSTEFEEFIAGLPPGAVTAILQDEHPQTRAVAILLMGVENAARVMANFSDQQQYELASRMARLTEVSGQVARDVMDSMRQALGSELVQRLTFHGVDQTARTLSKMGRESSDPLLARIAKVDKALSEQIRRRMVLFVDLKVLQDRAIQVLLKDVEASDLCLALKGVGSDVREIFLRNVSKRRRQDLVEELEVMGRVPRQKVEDAQQNIVEIALRLHDEGLIFFPVGADAEEMV